MFRRVRDVTVFTSRGILDGSDWISYVSHDADDGAWQFHGKAGPPSEAEAAVFGLGTIVDLDGGVATLSDLPRGWCAWRESRESDWRRAKL